MIRGSWRRSCRICVRLEGSVKSEESVTLEGSAVGTCSSLSQKSLLIAFLILAWSGSGARSPILRRLEIALRVVILIFEE